MTETMQLGVAKTATGLRVGRSNRDHLAEVLPWDSTLLRRRRMIDLRHSDFTGQDDVNGNLNLGSILTTETMKDKIANCGLGYIASGRAFTNTGQYAIGEFKARNPNWQYLMYFNFGHVGYNDPGLPRPFDSEEYQLCTPYRAKDLDGVDMMAWPQGGNPANPANAYWINYYFPPTPGYGFNKDLIDAQIDLFYSHYRRWEHRPIGIKIDYLQHQSSGYYRWVTVNNELDLNQNGVGYQSDAAEQAVFLLAQEYFIDRIREVFGPDFLITSNGAAAWPSGESTLVSRLNGWYLEGFPTTPWHEPAEAFAELYSAWQNPTMYRDFKGRLARESMPIFHTDLRGEWSMVGTRANCGRVAALIFDGWWRHRPLDGNGNVVEADLDDPTWDGWVATLGEPAGPPTLSGDQNGQHSYFRNFTGGVAIVILDAGLSGISQVTTVGVF